RPSSLSLRKSQQLWRRATSAWREFCVAKKHKTNVIAAQSAGTVQNVERGAAEARPQPRIRDFGEYLVDEVTRNPYPSEEVSGRREAAQGRPDRGDDRRVRPHCSRARARDQG